MQMAIDLRLHLNWNLTKQCFSSFQICLHLLKDIVNYTDVFAV